MGVVIGETAEVGDDCTIYQGVTLGGTSLARGAKRHPTLGRCVIVGAGAQVLGSFTVGDGARVGSNAVVVREVPAGATAVGNPARIIDAEGDLASTKQVAGLSFSAYGLASGVRDPILEVLSNLVDLSIHQQRELERLRTTLRRLDVPLDGEAEARVTLDATKLSELVED
jgi:serine O-acetyltransferase